MSLNVESCEHSPSPEALRRTLADPTSTPEEKSAAERMLRRVGPADPTLDADLIYREFLDVEEIRIIYEAALPEAVDLYHNLLGGPSDPRLAPYWCDTGDVLRIGCVNIMGGRTYPGVKPDVADRIRERWDDVVKWDVARWQRVLETVCG